MNVRIAPPAPRIHTIELDDDELLLLVATFGAQTNDDARKILQRRCVASVVVDRIIADDVSYNIYQALDTAMQQAGL